MMINLKLLIVVLPDAQERKIVGYAEIAPDVSIVMLMVEVVEFADKIFYFNRELFNLHFSRYMGY